MNKIRVLLLLIHTIGGTGGGITAYCKALKDLFIEDDNIEITICPILPEASCMGNKYDLSKIGKYIDENPTDIIHVNGYTSLIVSQIFPFAKKRNIAIAYTPHWHPFKTMRLSWLKKFHFNIFVKPYLSMANGIVSINSEETRFLEQFNSAVYKIPHWCRFGNLNVINEKKGHEILFVGNLWYKNKGFQYLKYLPEGKYKIHCVGRGNETLRSDMIQYVDVDDKTLAELYSRASLVVVPSKYEAFSYAALESLAHGTPIVVSDRVRIADYIHDDSACTIFKYGDFDDFVNKVESAINNKFDVDSVLSPFLKESALKSYKSFYRSLLK